MASLLGIYVGLRSEELCNLEYDDLKFIDSSYAVTIRKSKTDQEKAGFVFYIPPMQSNTCPRSLLTKYIA